MIATDDLFTFVDFTQSLENGDREEVMSYMQRYSSAIANASQTLDLEALRSLDSSLSSLQSSLREWVAASTETEKQKIANTFLFMVAGWRLFIKNLL